MKKNIFIYIVAALFVTSCGTKEVKENKEATESTSNTVELTDKQLKQLDITTGTLVYTSFKEMLKQVVDYRPLLKEKHR